MNDFLHKPFSKLAVYSPMVSKYVTRKNCKGNGLSILCLIKLGQNTQDLAPFALAPQTIRPEVYIIEEKTGRNGSFINKI